MWLGSTSGLEFEYVCADILRRCGFTAKKIGGAADGGRDILIWNGSRKIVVECKHHAKPTGRPTVQKLHSATMTEGAVGGVLISTGGFSSEAAGHTNARSSPDALNAIRHMRLGDIVLVDLDGLRQLARMANVMLRDGEDPATRDVPLEPLVGLFADLKSSPAPAKDLIRCEVLGHRVDTCWVADASIEQDFYNSAGRKVHRMTEKRTYACGSDGTILDGRLAKLVMSGGDATTKGGNRDVVRSSIVADMKKRYKKRVGYRGRNGVHYTMVCEPGERYMHISPKAVGVKRTAAAVKILRMRYNWSIPWWDAKLKCRMCGESSRTLNPLLICNDCGMISHARGCGGQCAACKKTVCERCAVTQKKTMRTKRLCSACFDA